MSPSNLRGSPRDAGEGVSSWLDWIADALDAHAEEIVTVREVDTSGVFLNPFAASLERASAGQGEVAARLRSLAREIAENGFDGPRARALSHLLHRLRIHHAEAGDALWRSVIQDDGVCD